MDMRDRITARIEELKTTRAEVSREAGKSPTFLRDFLDNPAASMTVANAEKIAEALQVSPQWLIWGTGSKDPNLAEVIDIWDYIDPVQREAIRTLAKGSARKK